MRFRFLIFFHLCFFSLLFVSCKTTVKGKNEAKYKTYQEACDNNDFVGAHAKLADLRNVFLKCRKPTADEPSYREYSSADSYIFQHELAFLLEKEDMDANIVSLIMETPLDGIAPNEGIYSIGDVTLDEHILGRLGRNTDSYHAYNLYNDCLARYNRKCDMALDYCILLGKKRLAGKILSIYKDDMVRTASVMSTKFIREGGRNVRIDPGEGYIYYEPNSKKAAQERFEAAVQDGVFK